MRELRFGVIGTGFWSGFQIPGWLEQEDIKMVGLYDENIEKATAASQRFGGARVCQSVEELLQIENLDFVDIITTPNTHAHLIRMAADYGIDAVCQKPLTDDFASAKDVVDYCEARGTRLFVNENFRWQAPIRRVKSLMDEGVIGEVFRARVSFCSAFPVFDNQPFLKTLDRFILTDIGVHTLDMCRYLLGEAEALYCTTSRVNPEIAGEDVATVLMKMKSGVSCVAEMSYASILEKEVFPETLMLLEGSKGSIRLAPGNEICITTRSDTVSESVPIKSYDWVDPAYELVHSSIVATQENLAQGLRGRHAETTGRDNLETLRLVWASYASAEANHSIALHQFEQ